MRNRELALKRDCISASARAAWSALTCAATRNCFCNLESFKVPLCSLKTWAAIFFHFILSSLCLAVASPPVPSPLVTDRSSASVDGGGAAAAAAASVVSDALCFLALCDDSLAATRTASTASGALLPLVRPIACGMAETGCAAAAAISSAASLPFWSFAAALACTHHAKQAVNSTAHSYHSKLVFGWLVLNRRCLLMATQQQSCTVVVSHFWKVR